MNVFLDAILLILVGGICGVLAAVVLVRVAERILRLFQLYPESQASLNIALKILSWFVGAIIFLLFLRLALRFMGFDFTTQFIENILTGSFGYMAALVVVLFGVAASRWVRERMSSYRFTHLRIMTAIVDFVIFTAFLLTALLMINVDVTVFVILYTVIVCTLGAILALSIGIPTGLAIHKRLRKRQKRRR